jgi:hypothetical protein
VQVKVCSEGAGAIRALFPRPPKDMRNNGDGLDTSHNKDWAFQAVAASTNKGRFAANFTFDEQS